MTRALFTPVSQFFFSLMKCLELHTNLRDDALAENCERKFHFIDDIVLVIWEKL